MAAKALSYRDLRRAAFGKRGIPGRPRLSLEELHARSVEETGARVCRGRRTRHAPTCKHEYDCEQEHEHEGNEVRENRMSQSFLTTRSRRCRPFE